MFLAATAEEHVARRLGHAGYLTRVPSRRPWRSDRWIPVDADWAFAPLIRVRAVLDGGRTAAASDTLLAGLAAASGLEPRILPYGLPGGRSRLDAAVRQLRPDLRALVAETQAAVDGALLSHRL